MSEQESGEPCPPWRTADDHADLTALRADHVRLVDAVRAYRALLLSVAHEALMAEDWHTSSVRVAKTPALSLGAATGILRDIRHGLEALEGCTLVEADERYMRECNDPGATAATLAAIVGVRT